MKALKITATVLLSVLLMASGIAAQGVALLRHTLLAPAFFGENGRPAYDVIGRTVVRKMADVVLERAPAIVLRTADQELAYALAEKALAPEQVAQMLETSGPAIARYLFYGGEIPALIGSPAFAQGQVAVVRGLLMDGVWDMLPDKPAFPAFMPFTPEWNLGYGATLDGELWLPRHYAGLAVYGFWLALAAVALFAGLLYLMWIRERKPFFTTTGVLLAANGMLLLALAAAISYWSLPLAQGAARIGLVAGAAELFGPQWPDLFRAALLPFRSIFLVAAAAFLPLGCAAWTMGIVRSGPAWPWRGPELYQQIPVKKKHKPKHIKKA